MKLWSVIAKDAIALSVTPVSITKNFTEMKRQIDKILRMFFDEERWKYAINKGELKDIRKADLIRLCNPDVRLELYTRIKNGTYEIAPPHTAAIPKDDGTDRIVYVNEPIDRVVLSIANDLLFDLMPEMIHPTCKSYLKGVGCGKIVQEISREVIETKGKVVGWKSDLSKYFDSVPIKYIDEAFDKVEAKHGHSALIDVLRKYYHSDWYFDCKDLDKNRRPKLKQKYQSLKQGCSVASWLANVILYHIDDKISKLNVKYVRYSDDMNCMGPDHEKAMNILVDELKKMGMSLNPKKVEYIGKNTPFKFLGFELCGSDITISKNRLRTLVKEIKARTKYNMSPKQALNKVNRYLYKGDGEHCWATSVLTVINVDEDLLEIDNWIKDRLRGVETKHLKVGGIGLQLNKKGRGFVTRSKGRNVKANREKTEPQIEGYFSLICMRNNLRTSRALFNTIVAQL